MISLFRLLPFISRTLITAFPAYFSDEVKYRKGNDYMEQRIRLLRADEIECRSTSVSEKGLSILLYKDARVDQRILDETFGEFGWQRTHQCINGNLYCTVEVYDAEFGRWVAKQDVGTVGNYEKEKSQASDSFKRACFNWGIGRELYSAPFIWVSSKDAEIKPKDGKFYCTDRFSVASIDYNDDREIISLSIANNSKNGKLVYQLHSAASTSASPNNGITQSKTLEPRLADRITDQQMHSLQSELQRTGVAINAVKSRYGFDEPQHMSKELYQKVMKALGKTKSADSVA